MKTYEYGQGLKIILSDGIRKFTTVLFDNNPLMSTASGLSVGEEVFTRGYLQPEGHLIIMTQRLKIV